MNTHIGVSYVFNRSRPFKLAFTKVGPSLGIKYATARKANTAYPMDAMRAGIGGTGSRRDRINSHDPSGMRTDKRAVERPLCARAILGT